MSNKNTLLFNDWLSHAQERVKSASVKVAADEEALTGIKDPNCQGTVAPPAHHDGNNREKLQLPSNQCNCGEANKEHNLMSETTPNGVGEGSYTTPVDGDAKDAKATSPTAPLDKIATMLRESIETLKPQQPEKQAAKTEETQKVAAQNEFEMPADLTQDGDIMRKLASIGAMMIGCEEGQQAVADVLERRCGEEEAASLIAAAREQAIKAASAEQQVQTADAVEVNTAAPGNNLKKVASMDKVAAAEASHKAWFDYFQTDFEKQAYAQGAVDGEQAAQAAAAGEEPQFDGAGEEGLSDEDVMQLIQAMVQSGEISPEDAEAILGAAGDDGQLSLDEVAEALKAAVESGQISPEEAEQIANELMASLQGGEGAAEEEAAPAEDPSMAAAEEGVAKTASVVKSLFA